MPSAYEVLGISENATDVEIKQARRKMLFDLHSDRLPKDLPEVAARLINDRVLEINNAYEQIQRERTERSALKESTNRETVNNQTLSEQDNKSERQSGWNHGKLSAVLSLVFIIAASSGIQKFKIVTSQKQATEHTESQAPFKMKNDSRVSNEILAKVIVANAEMQCRQGLPEKYNESVEIGFDKYYKFIRETYGVGWGDINGLAYDKLSRKMTDILKMTGSCENADKKEALKTVTDWLSDN